MMDLVFAGVNDWRTIKQRPQHLAERLAGTGRYRVLYVNPINYSVLTHVLRSAAGTTWRGWQPKLEGLSDNLWTFTPSPALPFSRRVRTFNRGNQALLAAQLRPALAQLGMERPVLWVCFPTAVDLLGRLGETGVIFDYLDNFPEFFRGGERQQIAAMEREMLSKADIVLATAQSLLEKCLPANANAHLVPNGVDVAHFARARQGIAEPPELARLPHPRFGYVGMVGRWTDVETLTALARAEAGGSVVVIGPWEVAKPQDAPPNFHAFGQRAYEQLPEYLAGFDVALIPFKPGPLTGSVNPVKLFEYAASGLPIVATATPELERYAGWCALARSRDEFVSFALALASGKAGASLGARAAAEVAAHDWLARVAQIERLIEGLGSTPSDRPVLGVG